MRDESFNIEVANKKKLEQTLIGIYENVHIYRAEFNNEWDIRYMYKKIITNSLKGNRELKKYMNLFKYQL